MKHHGLGYCNYPENGGGGHVDYCDSKLPCVLHDRPAPQATNQPLRPSLFRPGSFTSAAGEELHWKIECDAFVASDWSTLAMVAAEILPPFRAVKGVPEGGLPFAAQLALYATSNPNDPLLLADDVWTTGKSMNQYAAELDLSLHDWIGVVAFARGPIPLVWLDDRIWPIFTLNGSGETADPVEVKPERDPRHTCTDGMIGSSDGCPVCWPDRNGWMLEVDALDGNAHLLKNSNHKFEALERFGVTTDLCVTCGLHRLNPIHQMVVAR